MTGIRHLGLKAAGLSIILSAILGASLAQRVVTTEAAGNNVVSARSAAAGTSTIGSLGWHSYSGEIGVDLVVPDNRTGWLDLAALNQYLYWESSYYGSMGGGTSGCTGHVYQVWYSNGGIWTAAILLNVVHLKDMTANTYLVRRIRGVPSYHSQARRPILRIAPTKTLLGTETSAIVAAQAGAIALAPSPDTSGRPS